jgi:Fe-S cluster assembly protein SufD
MTTAASDSRALYLDAIRAHRDTLPGQSAAWIRMLRGEGLARFAELGFPTTRLEDWKYTNVAAIAGQLFRIAGASSNADSGQLQAQLFTDLPAHRLVFVNGRYAPALSSVGALPGGATVGSLAETIAARPAILEPHLGKIAPTGTSGFGALNAALFADGACVHLAHGVAVELPVYVVHAATGDADSVMTTPRNLVVLEEGAQATVIEQYRLQQENLKSYHVGGWYVRQARDSRFVSHTVDLGGLLARNDLHSVLDAEGAECEFNGLYVVDGRSHVDNHTCVDHAKPRGTSREFYKGVLDGMARAVFNGRVVVHPDAQRTDAQQMNNNLLLSKNAEVDTKPQLEIYADDVKCSHGATVGQLDADALFYLRSRAVDEQAARDLLTYAFANDVLSRMKLAAIRLPLEQRLTTRLLHGRGIRELELV